MPSTYTLNNGIELIGTGEQSGTWGDTTNTNFELLDTSLDGQVSVTLSATGSTGSPNTLPVSDGAASNGRNRLVIFGDGGDIGGTVYVQLTPNDAEKIIYVRNNLSGSRSILLFQGTYNASNDYEVPAGTTAVVFFNGAGTGAVAANVFNNAHFDGLNVAGNLAIGGNATFGDNDKAIFGAGSDLQIYHDGSKSVIQDAGTGNLELQSSTQITLWNAARDKALAVFRDGDYSKLYHNGAEKLATTSTGVNVTGTVTADGLTVDGTTQFDNYGSTSGKGRIQFGNSGQKFIEGYDTGNAGSGSYLKFGSGSTTQMTLDNSGNVGIGTSTPNAYSGYTALTLNHATNGGIIDIELGGNLIGEMFAFDSNTFALSAVGSRAINFTTNSSERMRITSAGLVGIGTTSPTVLLDLESASPIIRLTDSDASGTPECQISGAGGDLIFDADRDNEKSDTNISFKVDGSERMRIDSSGNVGIGTSSPSTFNSTGGKLAVASGAGNVAALFSDATYYTLGIKHTGVGSEAVGMFGGTSGSALALMTNNTERLRIDSSGNVGIGTTSPSSYNSSIDDLVISNSASGGITIATGTTSQGAIAFADGTSGGSPVMGRIRYAHNVNEMDFRVNNAERMRIDSSGNVGIGTSSPASLLHLESDTPVITLRDTSAYSAGTGPYIQFQGLDSGSTNRVFGQIYGLSNGSNSGELAFYTRNSGSTAEAMRLTSGGDLGLGTTTPHSTAWGTVGQGRQMEISGGTGTSGYGVLHISGSGQSATSRTYTQGVGDGKFYMAYDATANAHRMITDSNGFVLIGYLNSNGSYKLQVNSQIFATSSTIATSDGRYKENVTPITGALDLVSALNPVHFDWMPHSVHDFDTENTQIGFIAQEVEQVLTDKPYLGSIVKSNTCVVTPAEKDEDGNVVTEAITEDFLGIAESNLVALLTSALQEAITEITALKARVTTLEGA